MQQKQEEQRWENEWKQTRLLAAVVINSAPNFGKKKRKFVKPEDLVKLPSDGNTEKGEELTMKEVIAHLKQTGELT